MADFDNATATEFRATLAQELGLSLDQVRGGFFLVCLSVFLSVMWTAFRYAKLFPLELGYELELPGTLDDERPGSFIPSIQSRAFRTWYVALFCLVRLKASQGVDPSCNPEVKPLIPMLATAHLRHFLFFMYVPFLLESHTVCALRPSTCVRCQQSLRFSGPRSRTT